MSLEPGGRADKYGNTYERKFLTLLMLRILQGKYRSIVVEPLDQFRDIAEYVLTGNDNSQHCYQCKASNGENIRWTPSNLNSHNVFKRVLEIVNSSPKNEYHFVSPLTYGEINEICWRAKTNGGDNEFLEYQLTNETIRKQFRECAEYFGLDIGKEDDLHKLLEVVSKCHFETVGSGIELDQSIEDIIGSLCVGSPKSIRILLENYVDTNKLYGKPITSNMIYYFLEENGVYFRRGINNDKTVIAINGINNEFKDSFTPLNDNLIHRDITVEAMNSILKGNSVILYGQAGCGKSGCVQELISLLEEKNIAYLAVKLDKHIPQGTVDDFGKSIGLLQSPVHSLHSIADVNPCVLILDQLDALRWTSVHSASALDICKTIIRQVATLNKEENTKISIVFISRKYDLEYDNGLKNLFGSNSKITFDKKEVTLLSDTEVKNAVGSIYGSLSHRLKEILRTFSSLYIWQHIDDKDRHHIITGVNSLMSLWWKDILLHCRLKQISEETIRYLKNKIVDMMTESAVLSVGSARLSDYQNEIDFLISEGLLTKGGRISFTHQSFYDYFASIEALNAIDSGENIEKIVGDRIRQDPMSRYRYQSILQNIIDEDEEKFIKVATEILKSNNIRYYYKCGVFEIIGNYDTPGKSLTEFVDNLYKNDSWKNHIKETVFSGHPQYLTKSNELRKIDWISDEGLELLTSVNSSAQEFFVEKIRPFIGINKETDYKIYNSLNRFVSEDSGTMFEFRRDILKSNPELFTRHIGLSELFKNCSENAIVLLNDALLFMNEETTEHIYLADDKTIDNHIKVNYKYIIDVLLPTVFILTKDFNYKNVKYNYEKTFTKWTRERYEKSLHREVLNLICKAFCEFARKDKDEYFAFISTNSTQYNILKSEIVLSSLLIIPEQDSDKVISWVVNNFDNNIFSYTYNTTDYLYLAKQIIKKYSASCNQELLYELECKILGWKPDWNDIKEYFKHIVNENRNRQRTYYMYHVLYGHFQKELLNCIPIRKLSTYSYDLLKTLNRNILIRSPHFNNGFSSSGARSVVSPLYDHADKLSNKSWLNLIKKSPAQFNRKGWGDSDGKYYLESTPIHFAESLSNQAKLEPLRFLKLAMQFPENCYPGYLTSVLYAVSENADNIDLFFSEIIDFVRFCMDREEENIIIAIMRLIERLAKARWPDDIVEYVIFTALNGNTNQQEKTNVEITSHDLLSKGINSVRGCAIDTLTRMLWEENVRFPKIKNVIEMLCKDEDEVVNYMTTGLIIASYNLDKNWATEKLLRQLTDNPISIAFYDAWEIISRKYQDYQKQILDILFNNLKSQCDEVRVISSKFLCALTICYDNCLEERFLKENFDSNQIKAICKRAIASFDQEEFHEMSRRILEYFVENVDTKIDSLDLLFINKRIRSGRDNDFLIKFVSSKQGTYHFEYMLEFLKDADEPLDEYIDILVKVSSEEFQTDNIWESTNIIEKLMECIMKVLSNTDDNTIKTKCLDIYDNIFKKDVQFLRKINYIMAKTI